jgi:hypothetical protein
MSCIPGFRLAKGAGRGERKGGAPWSLPFVDHHERGDTPKKGLEL